MTIKEKKLDSLRNRIKNPRKGLPEDIFRFVSGLTPLVCVDLLIRNKSNEILLTWREDEFYGPGWHFPGGIVRFKEKFRDRIKKVALTELGVKIKSNNYPRMIHEAMHPARDIRGHFICLLFDVALVSKLDLKKKAKSESHLKDGSWKWHFDFPKKIIKQHEVYKK